MFSLLSGMAGKLNIVRTIVIHPIVSNIRQRHIFEMICLAFCGISFESKVGEGLGGNEYKVG